MGCLSDLVWEMDAPGDGLLVVLTPLIALELVFYAAITSKFKPGHVLINWLPESQATSGTRLQILLLNHALYLR